MMQLLQNMDKELQLLVFIVTIAVVFFVVWLALRKTRLWYWKVNEQTAALGAQATALEGIEQQLKMIGKSISDGSINGKTCISEEINKEEVTQPISDMEAMYITGEPKPEPEEMKPRSKFTTLDQCQSKNGNIYTAKQIEAQIRE